MSEKNEIPLSKKKSVRKGKRVEYDLETKEDIIDLSGSGSSKNSSFYARLIMIGVGTVVVPIIIVIALIRL